ncbi:hypothetical protein CORC01_03502 [Colletotrichum orchidophilum]|uniref:Uncharacterized protein n=1 Tax=Colletotrichum orchidophilum TaxID=1209926 RepID=A0A1G4BIS7_9PEZI|nr:uncharacterized protein CORC01_03502 [Colletotrichum orchidophilum]OHF01187.1 hypothetical protein CORC01_03502 [Colletotrichum orchidophilum]
MTTFMTSNKPPAESYPFGGGNGFRSYIDKSNWNFIINESATNTPRKAISKTTIICLSMAMGFITVWAIIAIVHFNFALHWNIVDHYQSSWVIDNELMWLDAHGIFWLAIFVAAWILWTAVMYRMFKYVKFAPFREARYKERQCC